MVSSVGLGLMSIGGAYGQKDNEADKIALLDHAHTIGERFWDTADVYVSLHALDDLYWNIMKTLKCQFRGHIHCLTSLGHSSTETDMALVRQRRHCRRMGQTKPRKARGHFPG
jgi:hypothetical protein